MTDYTELVKALRGKFIAYDVTGNHNSAQLYKDAADAIEALNRLVDLNTERCEGLRKQLREAQEQYEKHLNELEQQLPKRGDAVEVVRCKDCKWSISCGYISTRSYAEWKDWFCADGEGGN